MELLELWSRHPHLLRIYCNWWNPVIHLRTEGQFCAFHLSFAAQLHTPPPIYFFESLNKGSHLHLRHDAHFLMWKSLPQLGDVPVTRHLSDNKQLLLLLFDVQLEHKTAKNLLQTQCACFTYRKFLHKHSANSCCISVLCNWTVGRTHTSGLFSAKCFSWQASCGVFNFDWQAF